MNKLEIEKKIDDLLQKREKKIRNKNAISALLELFPPASALWQVLERSKESLAAEKHQITQDAILEMLLTIDSKLDDREVDKERMGILLEGVRAYGNVTGLKGRTSSPILRQLFSDSEVSVVLRDVKSQGNVTGVDLTVDEELELKKPLHIENVTSRIDFNVGPGRKVFFGNRTEGDSD